MGAVIGIDPFWHYVKALDSVNWYGAGWNASLMAPLSIVFGGGDMPGWLDRPALAKLIWIATSALLYAALIVGTNHQRDRIRQVDLGFAGAIPLMLLTSPLGWVYYFPIIGIAALAVAMIVRPLRSR